MRLSPKISLALVDDHIVMRNGLSQLLNNQDQFTVVIGTSNGAEFLRTVGEKKVWIDLCILDINMPEMDGFETIQKINQVAPSIKTIILSSYLDEFTVIKMLRLGARSYLPKSCDNNELFTAIAEVYNTDEVYLPEYILKKFTLVNNTLSSFKKKILMEHEEEFVKLCCTDMSYKEIAQKMYVSPRTVENYRDSVFDKLGISSRLGIAIFAMRTGLFKFS